MARIGKRATFRLALSGRLALPGLALAAIATGAPPAFAHDPQIGPQIGEAAPDATFVLVNGQKIHLADLKGQVVVINFWATWCVPCRQELPTLDAYYRRAKPWGLRVFAATTEDSLPEYQLHRLFDMMTIEPVRHLVGPYHELVGVPTNYVIDRAGVVRYAKAGAFDLDSLNALLIPLLRETAPPGPPAAPHIPAPTTAQARPQPATG